MLKKNTSHRNTWALLKLDILTNHEIKCVFYSEIHETQPACKRLEELDAVSHCRAAACNL